MPLQPFPVRVGLRHISSLEQPHPGDHKYGTKPEYAHSERLLPPSLPPFQEFQMTRPKDVWQLAIPLTTLALLKSSNSPTISQILDRLPLSPHSLHPRNRHFIARRILSMKLMPICGLSLASIPHTPMRTALGSLPFTSFFIGRWIQV